MNGKQELLRDIPRVDELAEHNALETLSRHEALRAVRSVLEALRGDILAGKTAALPDTDALAARALSRAERDSRPGLRRVVNLTGVILHTNLGRAPL
ncbi:MAG: L-seryl-tRNA(Sec) selenium transferase, partial [Oscillospiraceae bacterium]|nr:L-seryl-tRNA(Sec) selenium transferase [Oscillospiraceae bacterium]